MLLGACSGGGTDDGSQTSVDSDPTTGTDAAGWEKIVPGGDCECADGSEFAFWERQADPTKVVFFLDGGGACFDATTCAFTPPHRREANYDWNVGGEDPAQDGGIFDFARADNPFRRLQLRVRAVLHRRRASRRRHP